MLTFNQDGTEALMCGNGLRCFALYCFEHKIITANSFDVQTKGGIMKVKITNTNPFYALINLGRAFFEHENLLINSEVRPFLKQRISINQVVYELNTIFLGNIQTVVFVDNFKKIIDNDIGQLICHHEIFPEQSNVNFVNVIDKKTFVLKTYERGVGWTESCGTGAAASFFICYYFGYCEKVAKAILPFCSFILTCLNDDSIVLEGSAKRVFSLKEKIKMLSI